MPTNNEIAAALHSFAQALANARNLADRVQVTTNVSTLPEAFQGPVVDALRAAFQAGVQFTLDAASEGIAKALEDNLDQENLDAIAAEQNRQLRELVRRDIENGAIDPTNPEAAAIINDILGGDPKSN